MNEATILIVEDEAIVALDLQNRLDRLGYQVPAIAMTGAEAITCAESLRPDLIIMDIGLSGPMDGIQAAEEIVARFAVAIVFLTAYADVKTKQQAVALAPVAFLTKPFEDRELQSAIEAGLRVQK